MLRLEEQIGNHSTASILIAIGIVSSCCLYRFCLVTESSDIEPPTVYSKFPLVGHIWNMVWGRFEYFVKLRY